MGIDELPGGLPGSGDMTGDGIVDESDIPLFAGILVSGEYETCVAGDMNGDGDFDGADIGLFVAELLNP
jgi:hypothetical protein